MAIDTRDKRSSSVLLGLPFRGIYPNPDGSIGKVDRAHAGTYYVGITAGLGPSSPTVPGIEYRDSGERLHYRDTGERLHWRDEEP